MKVQQKFNVNGTDSEVMTMSGGSTTFILGDMQPIFCATPALC